MGSVRTFDECIYGYLTGIGYNAGNDFQLSQPHGMSSDGEKYWYLKEVNVYPCGFTYLYFKVPTRSFDQEESQYVTCPGSVWLRRTLGAPDEYETPLTTSEAFINYLEIHCRPKQVVARSDLWSAMNTLTDVLEHIDKRRSRLSIVSHI